MNQPLPDASLGYSLHNLVTCPNWSDMSGCTCPTITDERIAEISRDFDHFNVGSRERYELAREVARLRRTAQLVLDAGAVGSGVVVCPPVFLKPLRELFSVMKGRR